MRSLQLQKRMLMADAAHQAERMRLRPGSPEAREQGCICPVLDNAHGRGYLGDGERFGWVMRGDCPIHGEEVRRG